MERKSCFVVVGQAMPDIKQGKMFLPKHCQVKPDLHNGFTLIELLVVVLIIGILAAVAVPQYQMAVLKSRYTQLMAFGNAIEKAATTYHLANGVYPSRFDELSIDLPGTGNSFRKTYQDYVCELQIDWGVADQVYCRLTSSDRELVYRIILSSGTLLCMASKDWKLGNQVCKNITRDEATPGLYGDGTNNPFKYVYTFK